MEYIKDKKCTQYIKKVGKASYEVDCDTVEDVKGSLKIFLKIAGKRFDYVIDLDLLTEENIKANGCGMTCAYSDDIEIYVNHKETACKCDDFTHIGELYRNRGVK